MGEKIISKMDFLNMSPSAQLLYMHFLTRADDEGYINNPKGIMKEIKRTEEDYNILLENKFILEYNSTGIIVLTNSKMHDYITKSEILEDAQEDVEKDKNKYFEDKEINKAFIDFMVMRNKIHRPMTTRAVGMAIKKINKLAVHAGKFQKKLAIAIIEQSITHDWQDLYPYKGEFTPEEPVIEKNSEEEVGDDW